MQIPDLNLQCMMNTMNRHGCWSAAEYRGISIFPMKIKFRGWLFEKSNYMQTTPYVYF